MGPISIITNGLFLFSFTFLLSMCNIYEVEIFTVESVEIYDYSKIILDYGEKEFYNKLERYHRSNRFQIEIISSLYLLGVKDLSHLRNYGLTKSLVKQTLTNDIAEKLYILDI